MVEIKYIPQGERGNLRKKLSALVDPPSIPASFQSGLAWYIVRTNINCEARAEAGIKALGFAVYLPRERKFVRHARKRTEVLRPLFGRYLFVGFDINRPEWYAIRTVHGVESILCIDGNVPAQVHENIISDLQRAEKAGKFNKTTPGAAFKIGARVEADEGPFRSFIGEVVDASDKRRVEVLLEIFNRQTPVTFDASQLRLVDVSGSRK